MSNLQGQKYKFSFYLKGNNKRLMMNFRLYLVIIISCYIFFACDDDMTEPPTPTDETVIYHGDVYIACDNGPDYRFSLDSLIANCNATDTFNLSFPMEIQTVTSTCLYDGNFSLATSASVYDFSVARIDMQPTFTSSDVVLTTIPSVVTVEGDTLSTQTYPFYSAYEANWTDNRLELYIYNAYVGGCLHDKVLWRLERNE